MHNTHDISNEECEKNVYENGLCTCELTYHISTRNRGQEPGKDATMGRQKHSHEGFEIPDDFQDPGGRPVDHTMLGELIGAAFDGCASCQDPLLTLLVEDPTTTARLVELACVAAHGAFGGLPPSMTEAGVPGTSSPQFRRLARAGLDGENGAMFRECEQMPPTDRRAAANTALDTLIGMMAVNAESPRETLSRRAPPRGA